MTLTSFACRFMCRDNYSSLASVIFAKFLVVVSLSMLKSTDSPYVFAHKAAPPLSKNHSIFRKLGAMDGIITLR